MNKPTIVFFGTDKNSVMILDALVEGGFTPGIIVTTPDTKQGRKMLLTPPPVKDWAIEKNIPLLQPEKLDKDFIEKLEEEKLRSNFSSLDLFIVASYGKIIPEKVLNIPTHKTLNVHPSLLPLYRGATPMESAMLDDAKETGVTIIRMDNEMDHGPIIEQEVVFFEEWPIKPVVAEKLFSVGGQLLVELIPEWISGNIDEQDQDHELATYTKKIKKEHGEINFKDGSRKNFLKIQAYNPWPGSFFFHKKDDREIRVKITEAEFKNGKLNILKVIPEGKKEMSYEDFVSRNS